jgi:hypothetical protein
MARRVTALAPLLLVASIAASGCGKPADGKPCNARKDTALCSGPQAWLSCEGETWVAEDCLGPRGCAVSGDTVSCDTTLANEGTRCTQAADVACTPDRKSMLLCAGGKWTVTDRCLGPDACRAAPRSVDCDSSVGAEGDICTIDPASKTVGYACTTDARAVLTCKDRKWKKVESCLGPKACTNGATIECDGATASPGDFCVEEPEEDHACSPDRKAQLVCKAGAWKVTSTCLGPTGCSDVGDDVECDITVQDPGAPCDEEDEGTSACSTDGKTILACRKGKYVTSRTCPKRCDAGGEYIECK